ncbi:MAG: helix-turn-helix domain-containing protein, partial [Butyricicoccaceae bacterium]
MILSQKILQLRKKQGWSQEELAEKLGVSRQSVSKWEGAVSLPEIDKIMELAAVFGVTTDYLLRDDLETAEYAAGSDRRYPVLSIEEADAFLDVRRRYACWTAAGVAL